MPSSPEGPLDQIVRELCPQLLSLTVHELRTPAGVVGGYLRMLQRDATEPLTDRQRKMVDEAEKSCARLVAMIAQLSDISKLDSRQLPLARERVDVLTLAAEVASLVHDGDDRKVRVVFTGQSDGGPLTGDSGRLRNAVEAIVRAIVREKAGPATVAVDGRRAAVEDRDSAMIVIADATDVQNVYEAERGLFDEKRGGLGLALPLARRVVEAHGGRVWSPAARDDASDARARGAAIVCLPVE